MSRKIIGITVGTTISPKRIEKDLKPVKTINGVSPDDNGNVEVDVGKLVYEYAVEAGYEGTEEEFAEQLSNPNATVALDDGEGNVEVVQLGVMTVEEWVFTLEDGSTVTKQVVVK